MANRFARSFPPRQTNRDWIRSQTTAVVPVAAASKVLINGFTFGEDRTVRRTIGEIFVVSDQTAAIEHQVGAVGALVVSDVAFAAGSASIPGPFTERSNDYWAMWLPFSMTSAGMTSGDQGTESLTRFFDSRGQRKLPHGSVYAFIVENSHATHGFNVLLSSSVLVSH